MQFYSVIAAFFLILAGINLSYTQQYDTRDADRLLNDEKFQLAADIYKSISIDNPYNGYIWANYGYCLYKMKDYNGAIESYKKAIETGYESSSCMYNVACCYSLLNDPEQAVKWLDECAKNKFNNLEESVMKDTDFDPIRNSEIFKREIIPSGDMISNRIEGWKTDLRMMKKRMEETHFNIFSNITVEDWEKMFGNLNERIGGLDDPQIFTEMLKITSKVGDGHTTVYPGTPGKFKPHYLPMQFFMFEDGLYVIQASPDYKELAGKKISRIGITDSKDLLSKIREVASLDNEPALKWTGMYILTINDVLYGLGITEKYNEAELTIEGGRIVTVKSVTEDENPIHSPGERSNWIKGWKTDPAPLYLKDRQNMYWFEFLPEKKMIFVQLNGIGNKKEERLKDFADRVFKFIDSNDVGYLILDIRFNGGGNNTLNNELVQRIASCEKINRNGNFFAIIGRNTFSAAQCLANELENRTKVVFVGEPTGSKPNFVGESSMILLPYSGLQVSCSSRYWQSYFSDDYRKWIAPQIGVKYYYSDYANGIDPAFDAIMKYINK